MIFQIANFIKLIYTFTGGYSILDEILSFVGLNMKDLICSEYFEKIGIFDKIPIYKDKIFNKIRNPTIEFCIKTLIFTNNYCGFIKLFDTTLDNISNIQQFFNIVVSNWLANYNNKKIIKNDCTICHNYYKNMINNHACECRQCMCSDQVCDYELLRCDSLAEILININYCTHYKFNKNKLFMSKQNIIDAININSDAIFYIDEFLKYFYLDKHTIVYGDDLYMISDVDEILIEDY